MLSEIGQIAVNVHDLDRAVSFYNVLALMSEVPIEA